MILLGIWQGPIRKIYDRMMLVKWFSDVMEKEINLIYRTKNNVLSCHT